MTGGRAETACTKKASETSERTSPSDRRAKRCGGVGRSLVAFHFSRFLTAAAMAVNASNSPDAPGLSPISDSWPTLDSLFRIDGDGGLVQAHFTRLPSERRENPVPTTARERLARTARRSRPFPLPLCRAVARGRGEDRPTVHPNACHLQKYSKLLHLIPRLKLDRRLFIITIKLVRDNPLTRW